MRSGWCSCSFSSWSSRVRLFVLICFQLRAVPPLQTRTPSWPTWMWGKNNTSDGFGQGSGLGCPWRRSALHSSVWLSRSAATCAADEFRPWARLLWPGFILQNEHSPLQLKSSLWPWQTDICREPASLESSVRLALMNWVFKYVLEILEAPKNIGTIFEEPAYCCPERAHFQPRRVPYCLCSTRVLWALFHLCDLCTFFSLNAKAQSLLEVSEEPFIRSAIWALWRQLIQNMAFVVEAKALFLDAVSCPISLRLRCAIKPWQELRAMTLYSLISSEIEWALVING